MTTREQALTVDCPECGKPAGEMCVMKNGRYVGPETDEHGYRIGNRSTQGYVDRSQVGAETVRAHNGRNAAYFWSVLPPAIDVPDGEFGWGAALGPFTLSTDRRYRIKGTLTDRPARIWTYELHRREREDWVLLGSFTGQYPAGQYVAIAQAKALCDEDRGAKS